MVPTDASDRKDPVRRIFGCVRVSGDLRRFTPRKPARNISPVRSSCVALWAARATPA